MVKRIIRKLQRTWSKPVANKSPAKVPSTFIDISNEYIEWLTYANAGMLNRGNLYCIDYAIQNSASTKPIVEIGSFCGLSTNIINYYLSKHGKSNQLITADKWIFEGSEKKFLGDTKIEHTEYRNFVKDTYKRNVQMFSKLNLPYTIEVFSDEFFELWQNKSRVTDIFGRSIELGGQVSFAFIDGNHTYEFAKRDFENTDKYLEIGGFILFDDSHDRSRFGCARLVKEIEQIPAYELVAKNPNYFFKKKA